MSRPLPARRWLVAITVGAIMTASCSDGDPDPAPGPTAPNAPTGSASPLGPSGTDLGQPAQVDVTNVSPQAPQDPNGSGP